MRLSRPTLGPEELAGVAEVLDSGYLTQGSRANEFERRVAEYVGAAHAFATSSCTTGLHLILSAMDIGPGDDVIVPDFTFPATSNVVVQTGARPVLVDVDPETLTMSVESLMGALTDRTKAVMVVHAFGLCADVASIRAALRGTGIPVIEDAATALGSEAGGRRAGALADAACFSFHPRKIITTGEGGMITTDDKDLADRIAVLRSHGGVRGPLYLSFADAGFNYRLSDVHAAIGLAQMDRLDGIIADRRRLAAVYRRDFSDVPGVALPPEPHGFRHTYQSFVVLLDDGIDRDEVIRQLAGQDIETTLGTYSMHCQPYFQQQGHSCGDLPNSARAFRQSLTLPLHPAMAEADVAEVAEALRAAVSRQLVVGAADRSR